MVATNLNEPRRVVIVGGGIAALEAALALHDLAGTQVRVTLIAPEPDFMLQPLDVVWPFADWHPRRLPFERFMDERGGHFRRTVVLSVDAARQTVRCATGADEPYDALIVAVGASARRVFEHGLTFGADVLALNELLADVERSHSRGFAFVVPKGCTWPLPLYELALMAADEVREMRIDEVQLHFVTPEAAPLDIFGSEASGAVADLLEAARITLHCGADPDIHPRGHIGTGSGDGLDVASAIALPVLDGPRLKGLPADARGYIPVDDYGRVVGVDAVYAAGDATSHPIKQGDLACQQADAVAAHVAATIGAQVDAVAYAPVLRGRLVAGRRNGVLGRPEKSISGRYLGPYLEAQGVVEVRRCAENRSAGVDVRLSRSAGWGTVQSVTSTL